MAKSNITSFDNLTFQDIETEAELIPLLTPEDEEALRNEDLPDQVPILPLRNTVLFPGVVIPITAGRDKSIQLIKDANNSDKIIGVVALMPTHEVDVYELTKMGVKKASRNKGVGKLLLKKCIEQASENKLKKVIIYSNRKLENAIYLYKLFGFTEVELEKESNYQRADIKLEFSLQ